LWADQFRPEALAVTERKDFDAVMRRMVASLDDQHSSWLGTLAQSLLVLERSLGTEQRFLPGTGLVVEKVFPQGPAQNSLQRGDVIIRINGQDLRQLSSHEVIQLFSAALSEADLSLDIRRNRQRLNMRLSPKELNLNELKHLPQSKMLNQDVGYIYLPSFIQANTAEVFHQQLELLQSQGATKLILDLRDNPGGGLGELGLVMCAFFKGAWLQAVRQQTIHWTASCNHQQDSMNNTLTNSKGETVAEDGLEQATFFEGPLVVLVSQNNNSAGEVAALVLQYQLDAIIIGKKTLGNVEALQEFRLSDGSVVLVAVANLQGIGGKNFNLGVTPDIESQTHLSELARGFDAPVAEALKILETLPFPPGKYF
jgi:carboxyl-terminal processing protease